jgi:hypothetical protein
MPKGLIGSAVAVVVLTIAILLGGLAPEYRLNDTLCLREDLTASDGTTQVKAGRYRVVDDSQVASLGYRMVNWGAEGRYGIVAIRADGSVAGGVDHVDQDLLDGSSSVLDSPSRPCSRSKRA